MFYLKYVCKFAIAVTISLILIFGCATSADKRLSMLYPQNTAFRGWPDKELEKSFQEYWLNRFDGRVEESYQMESPYFREMINLGKYNNYVKQASKNKLVNVEILEIAEETDFFVGISCVVRTKIGTDSPVSTQLIDRWVFVGDKWYHAIKDPILLSN